jgi:hypothetical protein
MDDNLLEQRINIEFSVKLEKNATDIYKMLHKVFEEGIMTWVFQYDPETQFIQFQ